MATDFLSFSVKCSMILFCNYSFPFPHQWRSRLFRYFYTRLKHFFSSLSPVSACLAVASLQVDGLPILYSAFVQYLKSGFSCPFFPLWIFMDGICQDLRCTDPLNKVLVCLSIHICAEEAKPCLGAFPYFIRLDANVHCFTAWLISSKISRFFTSFWQWEAGRRAFNWTYITKTLHLRLLYIRMESWPQICQSYNE